MKKPLILLVFLCAMTAPAIAQDIPPAINPVDNAHGLFLQSRMGAQAKRIREKNGQASAAAPTAQQKQACASRPRFRAQYGADHPKVRQLDSLCRQAGL